MGMRCGECLQSLIAVIRANSGWNSVPSRVYGGRADTSVATPAFTQQQEPGLEVVIHTGGVWITSNYLPVSHRSGCGRFDCSVLLSFVIMFRHLMWSGGWAVRLKQHAGSCFTVCLFVSR